MAKYNREFLVPYLRDVCALQLAYQELSRKVRDLNSKIDGCEKGVYNPYPAEMPSFSYWGAIGWGICALILGIIAFNAGPFIGVASGMGAVFLGFAAFGSWAEVTDDKHQFEAQRAQELDIYYKKKKQNDDARRKLPGLKNSLMVCSRELEKVRAVLARVYNANIVPRQYRDLYASVYLYDYFSTGRSDDLDMALNTYVLEQIKSRLDEIIDQQRTIILNQEISIANQRATLESQRQFQNSMEAKARQIAASQEEQSTYLSMIESNTAATAYFAAADYFRNL